MPLPSVKPLSWMVNVNQGQETHYAESVLGRYAAWVDGGVAYVIVPGAMARAPAGKTLEEGMARCQEDFSTRILGALEP